jgi:hypothetical protein
MPIPKRIGSSISAVKILSVILLSSTFLNVSAQNETTLPLTQPDVNTNDTSFGNRTNGSQPILFEVASSNYSGKPVSSDKTALNQSSFKAQIEWTPNAIGSENIFNIRFLNPISGEEIQDVKYDIMLFNEGNHLSETHRSEQQASRQKYIFPEQGFYTLKIDNIGNTTASIDLPIQVIPEFADAASTSAMVAGLLGILLFAVKLKTRRQRFFASI